MSNVSDTSHIDAPAPALRVPRHGTPPAADDVREREAPARAVAPARALPWWWSASLVLLALALVAYRLAHTIADPDLWGHLRFGLDLLDTWQIDRPDIYSYVTAGVRWINHEWLCEALMAIAYRAAGPTGLIALKTAIGLAIAVLIARHLLRQGLSLLATLLITSYGMVAIYPGLRPIRPQAFTYLATTLVMLLIASRPDDGRSASDARVAAADGSSGAASSPAPPLWWAVPIMALWANLHGGFVAGLALLGIWWATRAAAWLLGATPRDEAERRALLRDGATVAAATLATLANPYGWDLWVFLARTLKPRPEIAEWQAVPIQSLEGLSYLLILALGIVGAIGQTRPRRLIRLPLLIAGALLPLTARRHAPLFAIIVMVLFAGDAARLLDAAVRRRWPRMQRTSSDRMRPVVAAALVLEALIIFALTPLEWRRIAVDTEAFPIVATQRLVDAGVPANVAVFFNWGEYVLWHAGPRVKVSVDGRRETVYPDDVYAETVAFTDGAGDWDRLLTEHPTDAALVSATTPAAALIAMHPQWELVLRDDSSLLYVRRGSPLAAALRALPPLTPEAIRSAKQAGTFP